MKTKRIVSVFLILTMIVGMFTISAVTTSAVTKPAAPQISLSNKSNGIRVEWNRVPGAVEYIVYYKDNKYGSWNRYYTANNYYPYLHAESGKLYYFQVQSVGLGKVKGNYSKVRSLTYISQTSFNKKTNLEVSPFLKVVNGKLCWNKVKGANQYEVVRYCYTTKKWERVYKGSATSYNVRMQFNNTNIVELLKSPLRFKVRAMYTTKNTGTAYGCWSKVYEKSWGK